MPTPSSLAIGLDPPNEEINFIYGKHSKLLPLAEYLAPPLRE